MSDSERIRKFNKAVMSVWDKKHELHDKIGRELIALLGLKVKDNGYVQTDCGDKTAAGLCLNVQRVFDEAIAADAVVNSDLTAARQVLEREMKHLENNMKNLVTAEERYLHLLRKDKS